MSEADGTIPSTVTRKRKRRSGFKFSTKKALERSKLSKEKATCSVNFLFFELSCEILCERNLFFIVFRKLEVVRC
jgi:hypothetical protein